MIQRIQTIWLLLAAACCFLMLHFSFYNGNKISNDIPGNEILNAVTGGVLLTIVVVAAGLMALVSVFLFKDRKTQLKFVIIALLLSGLSIYLFFRAIEVQYSNGELSLSSVFEFLAPIFLILAARGIYKDERLIKSLNRLR